MTRDKRKPFIGEDRILRWENRTGEEVGLMEFVERNLRDAKRTDIKRWLKYGHLSVDGVVSTGFATPVGDGAAVELNLSRPFVKFHHRRVEIIYEDDHILVANKGYGLLSVGTGRLGADGSRKREESAYGILKDYIKEKNVRNKLYVVHRLDRDTSGLIIFAKSEAARDALQHNWQNMILSRKYVAVVEGRMEKDEGEVTSALNENSSFYVYSKKNSKGKKYTTLYRVIQRGENATLVEFELLSSGKNQIRVHASDIGHPIVGDRKYGGSGSSLRRLALHARTLDFAHPITKKYMRFETPVPTKFIGFVRHS